MRFSRSSGILLHPTSFPGKYGIGDLGEGAYRFVDFLVEAGQTMWQVLPLGPTGYGDSPYQSFSAFAGNPLLIAFEPLVEQGLLTPDDLPEQPFPQHEVDYGWVIDYKFKRLQTAYETFKREGSLKQRDAFLAFCYETQNWLDDYAMFMALKNAHDGAVWNQWDKGIAFRESQAVDQWRKKLHDEIEARKFWQFLFFQQWQAVKDYANEREIQIIGDIPIYVAHDSADVWAHPELYYLADHGNPSVVAGVPPDYFSATGQLWGNPIYRWDDMKQGGYSWWLDRFRETYKQVDIIRLDHFRGFESYWEVPGGDDTAENGRWVNGPGSHFFQTLQEQFGELPIIAENLGVITDEVEALREEFAFPGMGILQFAFGHDASNPNMPHNYPHNHVAYTGTHDNDTTVGWWTSSGGADSTRSDEAIEQERHYARQYLNTDGNEIHWTCIRCLMACVADTVIFPLQDILGLGSEARMNQPGRPAGNWKWRYSGDMLKPEHAQRLLELSGVYGRLKKG